MPLKFRNFFFRSVNDLRVIKLVFNTFRPCFRFCQTSILHQFKGESHVVNLGKKQITWLDDLVVDFVIGIHAALFHHMNLHNNISRKIKGASICLCNLHKCKVIKFYMYHDYGKWQQFNPSYQTLVKWCITTSCWFQH